MTLIINAWRNESVNHSLWFLSFGVLYSLLRTCKLIDVDSFTFTYIWLYMDYIQISTKHFTVLAQSWERYDLSVGFFLAEIVCSIPWHGFRQEEVRTWEESEIFPGQEISLSSPPFHQGLRLSLVPIEQKTERLSWSVRVRQELPEW